MTTQNEVKYIGNPVVNHKVEQFVRTLLLPASHTIEVVSGLVQPYAQFHQLIVDHSPYDLLPVGTSRNGYTLFPETISLLALNGYHADAVLFELSRLTVEGAPALIEQDGVLYVIFAALVALGYQVTYPSTYGLLLTQYKQYTSTQGYPKHFATGIANAGKRKATHSDFKGLRQRNRNAKRVRV